MKELQQPRQIYGSVRFAERERFQTPLSFFGNAEARIVRHRDAVLRSTFGTALRRHIKELQQARQAFGPVRLSEA